MKILNSLLIIALTFFGFSSLASSFDSNLKFNEIDDSSSNQIIKKTGNNYWLP